MSLMLNRSFFFISLLALFFFGCRAEQPQDDVADVDEPEHLPPLIDADGHDAVKEEEAVAEPDRVEREGDRLVIRLRTGEDVVLEDVQEGSYERDRLHRYRGLLEEIGYHMVEVRMYEGGGFLLIRDADGQQIFVDAPPVVSPDRSRFVTTSMDLEAGYVPTAIRVYRVEPDGIENEWAYEATEWGPSDARWVNNQQIEFTRNFVGPAGEVQRTERGVLRYSGDEDWVLVES